MRLVVVLCLLFFPAWAWSKLDLPRNLNSLERRQALEVLGYGSAVKILADPFPLGGYSGVQVGISYHIIPTTDLAGLGSRPSLQGETSYAQLSFAKGLYYNFDLFLDFAPMGQSEQITSYGGGLRWGFFEAEYLPITLSFQAAANSTSFQNRITTSTQGLDLLVTFNIENFSMYVGAGSLRAAGTFMGGTDGVTDTGSVESEAVSGTRLLGGFAAKFSDFFAAIELSRVVQPSYGAKIGMRF